MTYARIAIKLRTETIVYHGYESDLDTNERGNVSLTRYF